MVPSRCLDVICDSGQTVEHLHKLIKKKIDIGVSALIVSSLYWSSNNAALFKISSSNLILHFLAFFYFFFRSNTNQKCSTESNLNHKLHPLDDSRGKSHSQEVVRRKTIYAQKASEINRWLGSKRQENDVARSEERETKCFRVWLLLNPLPWT